MLAEVALSTASDLMGFNPVAVGACAICRLCCLHLPPSDDLYMHTNTGQVDIGVSLFIVAIRLSRH